MGTLGTEMEAKPDHREHGEGGEWKKRNTVLANCSNEQKLDSKTNTTKCWITMKKKFKQQKKNKKQTEQQRLKNKTRDPVPWLI